VSTIRARSTETSLTLLPDAGHCVALHSHAPDKEGGVLHCDGPDRCGNPVQRFGSALNLDIHFQMPFLDGVYFERPDGTLRFRWVKAPTSVEPTRPTQTLARCIGRYLERQGLLERDAENSYLAGDGFEAGPMEQLLGASISYSIAVGPQGVYAAGVR
jgi:hypothetical protein